MREHIGFGCVALTSFPFKSKALYLLDTAFDEGIRFYDTAPLYGKGYSEKIVGEFIKKKRDKIIISTKFGLGDNNSKFPIDAALLLNYFNKVIKQKTKNTNNLSFHSSEVLLHFRKIQKDTIKKSLENSLSVLKTDYIDNYLLHEGMPHFLTEDSMDYLLKMKEKGIIRKLGIACNLANLKQDHDYQNWDIMQYEFLPDYNDKFSFIRQHSDKEHIHHSLLKPLQRQNKSGLSPADVAGLLLMYSLKDNPAGKALFSTTKTKNLIGNLSMLDKYQDWNPNELKKLVENAFY